MNRAAQRRSSGRPMGKPTAAKFAWAAAPSWLLPLLLLLASAVAEPPSNADDLPACKRDVVSDRVRQAEDQPFRHLAYNGYMGWTPFAGALMGIILVMLLTSVAMTWRNQPDQAPPPAATSGIQIRSTFRAEQLPPSDLLLENHELQPSLTQNGSARGQGQQDVKRGRYLIRRPLSQRPEPSAPTASI